MTGRDAVSSRGTNCGVQGRPKFDEVRPFRAEQIDRTELFAFHVISLRQSSAEFFSTIEVLYRNLTKGKCRHIIYRAMNLSIRPTAKEQFYCRKAVDQGLVKGGRLHILPLPNDGATGVRCVMSKNLKDLVLSSAATESLYVLYPSFRRGEPRRRRLEPIRRAFEGFRDIGADCVNKNRCNDILLSRIHKISGSQKTSAIFRADRHATLDLTCKMGRRPDKSAAQTDAISLDNGKIDRACAITFGKSTRYFARLRDELDIDNATRVKKTNSYALFNGLHHWPLR